MTGNFYSDAPDGATTSSPLGSPIGMSTFDLQVAVLGDLGMGFPDARHWLSDSWLLAERPLPKPGAGPGPLLDGVYRELEALERGGRARILRDAVRFEIRRVAGDSGESHGRSSGVNLRAAALDLVLPWGNLALPWEAIEGNRREPVWPGTCQGGGAFDARLRQEASRPVSERLFGSRPAEVANSPDTASAIQATWASPAQPSRLFQVICRLGGAVPIDGRPPSVEQSLWGLMLLAAVLDPGIDCSIAVLECRLVLGDPPVAPQHGLIPDSHADSAWKNTVTLWAESTQRSSRRPSPTAERLALEERIELATLVAGGNFDAALARSKSGALVRDQSLSLGALRAALHHRLQGARPAGLREREAAAAMPGSMPRPVAEEIPAVAGRAAGGVREEVRRIARFLGSLDKAWPGPSSGSSPGRAAGDPRTARGSSSLDPRDFLWPSGAAAAEPKNRGGRS